MNENEISDTSLMFSLQILLAYISLGIYTKISEISESQRDLVPL